MPCFYLVLFQNLLEKLPNENKKLTMLIEQAIEEQKREIDFIALKNVESKRNVELSWECNEKFSLYLESLVFLPTMVDCDKVESLYKYFTCIRKFLLFLLFNTGQEQK